jgi:hypothetical protein
MSPAASRNITVAYLRMVVEEVKEVKEVKEERGGRGSGRHPKSSPVANPLLTQTLRIVAAR